MEKLPRAFSCVKISSQGSRFENCFRVKRIELMHVKPSMIVNNALTARTAFREFLTGLSRHICKRRCSITLVASIKRNTHEIFLRPPPISQSSFRFENILHFNLSNSGEDACFEDVLKS